VPHINRSPPDSFCWSVSGCAGYSDQVGQEQQQQQQQQGKPSRENNVVPRTNIGALVCRSWNIGGEIAHVLSKYDTFARLVTDDSQLDPNFIRRLDWLVGGSSLPSRIESVI
jgi:hypothetical protein